MTRIPTPLMARLPGGFAPRVLVAALAVAAASAFTLIAGCASTPTPTVNHAAPPVPPPVAVQAPATVPPPPPAPPPLVPVPFDTAIINAATALFKNVSAGAADSQGKRVVVIDPLIDGVSGQQSLASRYIEVRLRDIARAQFPGIEIREFTSANVAQAPTVLVGTFTGITLDNKTVGKPEAYRICLALADLSANKIVSKGVARAMLEGVNTTPTPYFSDTPVWVKDETVDGYIKTCQGTKVGDPIDPVYRESIATATLISDAIIAYEQRKFRQALDLYARAVRSTVGDQLRVHSGLYLANWKLGKRADAEKAFAKIVDHGLATNRLAVKLLFQPGSTEFWSDAQVSGPYSIWLRQIAARVDKTTSCVNIVGHTSHSGSEPLNDKLSLARAQTVKHRLELAAPGLASRTRATGMGFRENVVGSGADDLSDLQDRRVEFKLMPCVG